MCATSFLFEIPISYLINLISNAIKHTSQGNITIRVVDKDNFAKVVVSDTGLGIPVEYQRFLFQKFKQANSEFLSRDASQGTGLGLYISRMLVENMGGKIQLDSSVEAKGSEFSFTIPS
jgi:signal transduction histidine kinase